MKSIFPAQGLGRIDVLQQLVESGKGLTINNIDSAGCTLAHFLIMGNHDYGVTILVERF